MISGLFFYFFAGAAAAWADTVKELGSGKLTLSEVLEPAIRLAEEGCVRLTDALRTRLTVHTTVFLSRKSIVVQYVLPSPEETVLKLTYRNI